jgi:hypothetical protein
MAVTNAQVLTAVTRLASKVDVILTQIGILMSQQDDISADTAAIVQAVTDLGTAVTSVQAEIDQLKAANPALDLTALDAAVASLQPAVAGVQGLVPPAAPPAG